MLLVAAGSVLEDYFFAIMHSTSVFIYQRLRTVSRLTVDGIIGGRWYSSKKMNHTIMGFETNYNREGHGHKS